jgi:4-amino-4-deoxy-L-arabinose transferase-like glycosyltransferase
MPDRRTTAIELLILAGFCAFFFYFGLAAFGLVGADEPRYAQIAREMLQRHDLVTPTLYGNAWLEKPPLYYWRAMVAYRLLGVNDWAARIPSTSAATFMVFVTYFFLRRFRPGTQLNGALITASSAGMIGFARGAGPDMHLAATFVIGMLAWFAWYSGGRKLWLAAFYAFMALGTLAKGPVAPLLAALIIAGFAWAVREMRLVVRTIWLPGILLYLAIALPWYVAVQLHNPQFLREFMLQHNLERFTTNLYHHRQPFWYFLPVLLLGAIPWTAFAVPGWWEAVRGWKERLAAHAALPRFLAIWTAVVVLFFSLSQSKLPGYILPAIPAFALLAADWVSRRERLAWTIIVIQGVLSGGLLGAVLLYPSVLVYGRAVPVAARWVAAGAALLVLVATVSTLGRKGTAMLRLVVLTPLIVGLALLLRPFAATIDNAFSVRPVAREIALLEAKPIQVAIFRASRETEYGLAFYRGQPILRYERGEVPVQDHLVVVPERYAAIFEDVVRPRRASRVGGFGPQRLRFYWVSTPREHNPSQ